MLFSTLKTVPSTLTSGLIVPVAGVVLLVILNCNLFVSLGDVDDGFDVVVVVVDDDDDDDDDGDDDDGVL